MLRWTASLALAIGLGSLPGLERSALGATLGASLGMVFPSGRLSDRSDLLGSFLLPAPSVGVRVQWGTAGSGGLAGWEGTADLAVFESDEQPGLRMSYVPIQVGRHWHVAEVGGLSLRAKAAGGLAFVSANVGERRSMTLGLVNVGTQFHRPLHRAEVVFETSIGMHVGGDFFRGYAARVETGGGAIRARDRLPVVRVQLAVLTR